jgi:hypothetical protein
MQRLIRLSAALLVLGLGACADVKPYEKESLGRRIMQFDANDLETSYQNKVLFSREVSGGRPGHSAGGGCGCAN